MQASQDQELPRKDLQKWVNALPSGSANHAYLSFRLHFEVKLPAKLQGKEGLVTPEICQEVKQWMSAPQSGLGIKPMELDEKYEAEIATYTKDMIESKALTEQIEGYSSCVQRSRSFGDGSCLLGDREILLPMVAYSRFAQKLQDVFGQEVLGVIGACGESLDEDASQVIEGFLHNDDIEFSTRCALNVWYRQKGGREIKLTAVREPIPPKVDCLLPNPDTSNDHAIAALLAAGVGHESVGVAASAPAPETSGDRALAERLQAAENAAASLEAGAGRHSADGVGGSSGLLEKVPRVYDRVASESSLDKIRRSAQEVTGSSLWDEVRRGAQAVTSSSLWDGVRRGAQALDGGVPLSSRALQTPSHWRQGDEDGASRSANSPRSKRAGL